VPKGLNNLHVPVSHPMRHPLRFNPCLPLLKTLFPARGRSVSSGTNTPSLDDGGLRAELHPEVPQDLINITNDADQCAARLTALQSWVQLVLQR